jgi:hypothetical protein
VQFIRTRKALLRDTIERNRQKRDFANDILKQGCSVALESAFSKRFWPSKPVLMCCPLVVSVDRSTSVALPLWSTSITETTAGVLIGELEINRKSSQYNGRCKIGQGNCLIFAPEIEEKKKLTRAYEDCSSLDLRTGGGVIFS